MHQRILARGPMLVLAALAIGIGYGGYKLGWHLWASHHWRAAEVALDERDFRQAQLHLHKCLEVWPHDHGVRLLAAQAARRAGELGEATKHLQLDLKLHGPSEEREREYALVQVQQGDQREADRLLDVAMKDPRAAGDFLILEAVIDLKVQIIINARHAGLTIVEGPVAAERVKVETALALWREARSGRADQVQGLIWLGRLHALTDTHTACADFRKALELDPEHFKARLYLAETLTQVDSREAVKQLDMLRQRDPQNVPISVLLAAVRRGLADTAVAAQILDEVLEIHPDHFPALLERGKTALDAGNAEEAERFLRRALALSADAPAVHLYLSRCLFLQGQSEDAQRFVQRYNELESARLRAQQLRDDEARAAWRKRN